MERLSLTLNPQQFAEFLHLLQEGVVVTARVPCTLKDLLCDQFGLTPEYVSERVTTIFLDGKATDAIDEALVREGSTVALSAAMPGLVGATMRRGGFYAAMRSAITHNETGKCTAAKEGVVRLKLFNMLLHELGPAFLSRGIIIEPAELYEFVRDRPALLLDGHSGALIDGDPVTLAHLGALPGQAVSLFVKFRE